MDNGGKCSNSSSLIENAKTGAYFATADKWATSEHQEHY